MILVCDRTISPRAANLQALLLDLGCPASVSAVSDIKQHLPIKLIITFCDVFDDLRRTPYDNIFAIVIGNGFVNSALNAKRADTTEAALSLARDYLYKQNGIDSTCVFPFGIIKNALFFANMFFEIYGNIVTPTDREYLIFKYLIACTDGDRCADADMIKKFCYPASSHEHRGNVVAAHISNLNKKIQISYGKKLIRSKRYKGYYIEIT